MRLFAIQAPLLIVLVAMSGCMGDGGETDGVEYTPRTHEFTLVVGASTTVPLYTLNDGETMMEVAAIPFTSIEDPTARVPNPEIRVKEGDTVILTVINNNNMPHTLHLHGGLIPWEMDGVPFLNQEPIHSGEEFTYTFENLKAGTYFYHCHVDVAHHMDLGMYGAFIVEEIEPTIEYDREYVLMLDEWDNCHVHGNTQPVNQAETTTDAEERSECAGRFFEDNTRQNTAGNTAKDPACNGLSPGDPGYEELNCGAHGQAPQQVEREWYPMTFPEYTPEYNTFLINGKAFPDTLPLVVSEGETVKLRFINAGEEVHAMHIHGHYYTVTHKDGFELASPYNADTLLIAPGERYDVVFEANNPGYWAFHDHIGLNVMNDNISPGGMFTIIAYDDFHGRDADTFERSIDALYEAREIIAEGGTGGHGHE